MSNQTEFNLKNLGNFKTKKSNFLKRRTHFINIFDLIYIYDYKLNKRVKYSRQFLYKLNTVMLILQKVFVINYINKLI